MQLTRVLLLAVTVSVISATGVGPRDADDALFSIEIDSWAKLGHESELFKRMVEALAIPTEMQRTDWRSFTGDRSLGICTICKSVVGTFVKERRLGMSEETMKLKLVKLCTLLNLQTAKVCEGVIELNLPILVYIVDSRPNLTASTICGVVLESKSCPLVATQFDWSIDLDDGTAKEIPPKENGGAIEVLQITDIHYDPNYEPYGNANCGEPTCCRTGQNATNFGGRLAGFWGDYNHCDSPWHTVVDALDHIGATHQNISYVYFTGDIIDHGVWETTRQGNIESLNKSYTKIHETFRNVPVYPILGNHEPQPLNQFAPKSITDDNLSTRWLYSYMADMWIGFGWLPESTRSTILQGGFYTVSPRKGFRIIALNNNMCYSYNWWLLYEPQDPNGQLQWLADTLLQAEANKEFVHLLVHMPPGDGSCIATWRREYHRIVNRFSRIIAAQFNGHTHNDELEIFYDATDRPRARNVAWNGGSLTTFTNLNSNYKVYTVDTGTFAVENFDNWMYNLTLANETPERRPTWYKSYSFKEEYNLKDLSLDSLHDFLRTVGNDEAIANRYYRNFFKHAAPSLQSNCDDNCRQNYACRIVTSLKDRSTQCANILGK